MTIRGSYAFLLMATTETPTPNIVSPPSSLIKNNASEKRGDRREGLLDGGKRVSRDR